jgi:uncharacterized delta-60 repeat protein
VYQLNGANGSLDGSFGTGGRLAFNFGPGPPSEAFVFGVGIQPSDGKIVAVGKPNNLAAPIAAARITTTGALDTATFNSPNGWVRLTMPPGYFGGNGYDVTFDPSGGIYIGGYLTENAQNPPASGNFPSDPVIAKLTTAGALDPGFGTGGFAILPVPGSDSGDAHGIARQPDGKFLIGGSRYAHLGASTTQAFAARFSAAGVLDPSFNPGGSPAGTRYLDHGSDSPGYTLALSGDGVAYVAGGVGGTGFPQPSFGIGAIQAFPPSSPTGLSTDPAGPADDNTPQVKGTVDSDATTVSVFANSVCSGGPSATGTVAEFEGAGIPVSVGDNTNTTFYATASWPGGTSACSVSSANYIEVSPPPPPVPVSSDPPSGANQNAPKIKGTAAGATTVELFTNASCSATAVATGTQATFQGAGIQVSVADNSTTSFYARSIGPGGTSACSTSFVTYVEASPPPPPVLVSSDPPSGANQNAPKIKGTAAGASTVELFKNASCSAAAVATGTQATFQGAGIQVSVADNSTTTFYARAIGPGGTSACSTTFVSYSEVTPAVKPPPGPTGQRAAALKKCKKIKNKLKKKKCKKRAQRLPV